MIRPIGHRAKQIAGYLIGVPVLVVLSFIWNLGDALFSFMRDMRMMADEISKDWRNE